MPINIYSLVNLIVSQDFGKYSNNANIFFVVPAHVNKDVGFILILIVFSKLGSLIEIK